MSSPARRLLRCSYASPPHRTGALAQSEHQNHRTVMCNQRIRSRRARAFWGRCWGAGPDAVRPNRRQRAFEVSVEKAQ